MVHLAPADLVAEVLEHATGTDLQRNCSPALRELTALATGEYHGVLAYVLHDVEEFYPDLRRTCEDPLVQSPDVVQSAHDPTQRIVERDELARRPHSLECIE